MTIKKILSSKFAVQYYEVKPRCISALVPLNPVMYRDENKNLVLTGNQHIFLGKATNGWYGIRSTTAKIRPYRSREFVECQAHKQVVTGKTALECAKKLKAVSP